MAADTMAFYGALHQLRAESSLTAGKAALLVPMVFMLGSI